MGAERKLATSLRGEPEAGCPALPALGKLAIGTVDESEEPAVGSYFVATYPPFSCWSKEANDQLTGRLAQPPSDIDAPLLLYVHVPFCVKRCQYCYYLSATGCSESLVDTYIGALLDEMAHYATTPALADRRLESVYFGGGTPSFLTPAQIHRLLNGMRSRMSWRGVREATFECAPQTVTIDKLRVLDAEGISRLSLGVQQLDDEVLRRSGRIHLVRDVEHAYALIRRCDFDVVNVDLMVGMVGESEESFFRSLDRIVELAPDSVTIYQLEIPFNTPLYKAMTHRGDLSASLPSWEVKHARLARAFERLEEAGYTVRSAYSAVRDAERHPFVYQDRQYRGGDLLGLGASSFSYLGGIHQQNLASIDRYSETVAGGHLPLGRSYALSADERLVREVVLRLKLGGFDAGCLREKFGVDVLQRFAAPLHELACRKWLTLDSDRVALTREGLVRADRLVLELYRPEHRNLRYS